MSVPAVLDAPVSPVKPEHARTATGALFVDQRKYTGHADTRQGRREIVIDPDILADFQALPFPDNTFSLVVFDPPHTFSGRKSWMAKKYGSLKAGWRDEIGAGFAECFRVLCPLGTLIFKWNEHRIPVSTVLSLTPEKPLFGQRCGTTARTHWIVFMKRWANSRDSQQVWQSVDGTRRRKPHVGGSVMQDSPGPHRPRNDVGRSAIEVVSGNDSRGNWPT